MDNGDNNQQMVEIPGSDRPLPEGCENLDQVSPDMNIKLTLILRRSSELPEPGSDSDLTHENFGERHGSHPDDEQVVERFANDNGLRIVEKHVSSRRVRLEGSAADIQRSFGVKILYKPADNEEGRPMFIREGPIYVPEYLSEIVTGVFGLDTRNQVTTHFRMLSQEEKTAGVPSLSAKDLAAMYNFPDNVDGSGQTIAIVEFGGGYNSSDMQYYFEHTQINKPHIQSVSVDGATNKPDRQKDADGEVALDIQVAGGIAPGAKIVVYFAKNNTQGFYDAIAAAVHDHTNKPSILSISWGGPENSWTAQSMNAMDKLFQDANALGMTVFAAAGDSGSSDGVNDGLSHVDFPASSPHVTACGGTHVDVSGTQIFNETVWNNPSNHGAGGGGISDFFDLPSWQQNANVPPSTNPGGRVGRGVPDVAGAADTTPGFTVVVDGMVTAAGGTSGVAPLWAGLLARINQALGRQVGALNPLIYGMPSDNGAFKMITEGNNGAYSAGPGWNPCCGLGSPNGTQLLQALSANQS